MLWVPLTIWAGFAQTLRNAAQRQLTVELGTLGATLVRFLYGWPFALVWLAIVLIGSGTGLPAIGLPFLGWVVAGGLAQIAATALLLRVMQERNFTLGVAYSKTELVQVAVFGLVFLGDAVSVLTVIAIAFATTGVLMLSPADREHPVRSFLTGLGSPAALIGMASGGAFALAAVGYRGAALELEASYLPAAAYTLIWAQSVQTLTLGGWLFARNREVVFKVFRAWRPSLFAGLMGTAASVGWFSAMTLEPAAHVRTLGLVELLFSYLLSRRIFREHLRTAEITGIALLLIGLIFILIDVS